MSKRSKVLIFGIIPLFVLVIVVIGVVLNYFQYQPVNKSEKYVVNLFDGKLYYKYYVKQVDGQNGRFEYRKFSPEIGGDDLEKAVSYEAYLINGKEVYCGNKVCLLETEDFNLDFLKQGYLKTNVNLYYLPQKANDDDQGDVHIAEGWNFPIKLDNSKIDLKSFRNLEGGFMRDDENVIYGNQMLLRVDPDSFGILENMGNFYYIKDKDFEYKYPATNAWGIAMVNNLSTVNYRTENNYLIFDDEVYYRQNRVMEADSETLKTFDGEYAQDKNNTYLEGVKIEGTIPESFK
ncbi:DKNYY domain-containing protein [Candidatus Dojkabacteria bacterium]|nr:DKNYY domain-containing protein [Candidatus Dojkabacteria bacterium]